MVALPDGYTQPTSGAVPTLFIAAGDRAAQRFIEFFTANIRNRNTRAAYAGAAARFARWCDAHYLSLTQLTPVSVAAPQIGGPFDNNYSLVRIAVPDSAATLADSTISSMTARTTE